MTGGVTDGVGRADVETVAGAVASAVDVAEPIGDTAADGIADADAVHVGWKAEPVVGQLQQGEGADAPAGQ
jgi:hypothetical protein